MFFFILKDTNEDELEELFQECGKIESVRIVRENKSDTERAIAYVNFEVSIILTFSRFFSLAVVNFLFPSSVSFLLFLQLSYLSCFFTFPFSFLLPSSPVMRVMIIVISIILCMMIRTTFILSDTRGHCTGYQEKQHRTSGSELKSTALFDAGMKKRFSTNRNQI